MLQRLTTALLGLSLVALGTPTSVAEAPPSDVPATGPETAEPSDGGSDAIPEKKDEKKRRRRRRRRTRKREREKRRSKHRSKKKRSAKKKKRRSAKRRKRRRRSKKRRRSRRSRRSRGAVSEQPPSVHPPADGFVPPYSFDNLMRGFDGGGCKHQGLDIGGVGPGYGVGMPVYAIVDAEVTYIGTPETDPKKYGRRDTREGTAPRGDEKIPRRIEVEGYGEVFPLTRTAGSSRSGVIIITRADGTELDGHKVRYLHLAAVHPDLSVGDRVEAGQEIGLMGGTGVQKSPPHLHLDIEDPRGYRVDPAPLLGLQELRPSSCKPRKKKAKRRKRRRRRRSKRHKRRRRDRG